MRQKVTIKITNKSAVKLMEIAALCTGIQISNKSRVKLMKTAALCNGVKSVALMGDGKDIIEIIGEGIEAVKIAKMMRKRGRRAVSVRIIDPAKNEVQASSTSGINEVQVSSTSGINEGSMEVMQLPEPIAYPDQTPSYPVYNETIDHDPRCEVMLIAVCIFPVISLLISLAKEMLSF